MIRNIYKKYQKLVGTENFLGSYSKENVQYTNQDASDIIYNMLMEDKPLMIARFGAVELSCILNNNFIDGGVLKNIFNVIKGYPYFLIFNSSVKYSMTNNAGFFPATDENLKRFSELYLKSSNEIDILASWMKHERYIYSYMKKDHKRIFLDDLDSFRHENPWTRALEGKKVLVIHPFEESIKEQYEKHALLFKDKRVLPKFEIVTLKAVQSIGGKGDNQFKDWFEALDYMVKEIEKKDFDIALIGAGAYGMPLAYKIKKMGKKAIHIGGSLQCLFGIKGSRWEAPVYNYNNLYYNENWIRPNENEKPKTAEKVENACYW